MSLVTLLVDLPGSGKSTWRASYLAAHPDTVIISSDDMIEAQAASLGLTYSEAFGEVDLKAIDKAVFEAFDAAIAQGQDIVVDRTNLSPKVRRRFLSRVPAGHRTDAVVFMVEDDVLTERLERRGAQTGKVIPPVVLSRMRTSYVAPTLEEGFAEVRFHLPEAAPAADRP